MSSRINQIQAAIRSLEGGAYHKLMDEYIFKKYELKNIHPLGIQSKTNKSIKGTPDTYVENEDETLTLIMYGTNQADPFNKIKEDIEKCLDEFELEIREGKIKNIISGYTSVNVTSTHLEELQDLKREVEMKFINIGTLAHDLLSHYPEIAADHLKIPIDSSQIFTPLDFIERYDNNETSAPLKIKYYKRKKEMEQVTELIDHNKFTLISGQSGIGKTKLVIETCKQYERNGYKVYCIKNNGLEIYEDVRTYFREPGEYLLFIDDINETVNLNYILEFMLNPPEGVSIKIVATVRDYAKQLSIKTIKDYTKFNEYKVSPFKPEEIEIILEETLNIKHPQYLRRISDISKGNIRLAILAGLKAKQDGYQAISDSQGIFDHYYEQILKKLNDKDNLVLFIISIMNTIRFNKNNFAIVLLDEFNITESEFMEICYKLNGKELIDLYHNEVVHIGNQSLRDYLLIYILIKKKTITISRLLELGFPKYKSKIIFALNTIAKLINSDKVINYIKEEVNDSWEVSNVKEQQEYLKSFYHLNETKALQLISSSINNMKQGSEVDIELNKFIKNKNINHEFILILGNFKYSKHYDIAIELLVLFLGKRPSLFDEFYSVFSNQLSYDEYSYQKEYEKEYQLIQKIWELSEYGKNHNLNVLMIHIFSEFLKCSVDKVEQAYDNKNVNFIRFEIMYTKGTKKLRELIWTILAQLYEREVYQKLIYLVLTKFYGGVISQEEFELIFEYDLKSIISKFNFNWNAPTFDQSYVLYSLKEHADSLDIKYDEKYLSYQNNNEFIVYSILSDVKMFAKRKDRLEPRQEEIKKLIDGYDIKDFDRLFSYYNKFEKRFDRDTWALSESITILFSLLKDDNNYVKIVTKFMKNDTPFFFQEYGNIINEMIGRIGTDNTYEMLNQYNYGSKNFWLSKFWELIPAEEISKKYIDKLLIFIESQKEFNNPAFPSLFHMKKFNNIETKIIENISNQMIEMKLDKSLIARFLSDGIDYTKDSSNIIELFSKNIHLLEDLYLLVHDYHFDYKGNLLVKLIENNLEFWSRYTMKLSESDNTNSFPSSKFKAIWKLNNYYELIEIAYENLVVNEYLLVDSIWSQNVFTMHDKNLKDKWIKQYIKNNFDRANKIKTIFNLIDAISESQSSKYYKYFLENNKNIDDFKQLPLFLYSYTWIGSEIPSIDKNIEKVLNIISQLNGLQYIDHINYLNTELENLKKHRREREISEYIRNF